MSYNALCCFSLSLFPTPLNFLKKLTHVALQNHMIIRGVVTVNHMNHDIAEINSSNLRMLPGSFLHEKEPGYEATALNAACRNLHGFIYPQVLTSC